MGRLPDGVVHAGLVLRRWTPDDAELLHAVVTANLEHLRPRMSWVAFEPRSLEEHHSLLCEWDERWRSGGDSYLAVLDADRPAGPALGSCGLHRRIGPAGLEIGYWVDHDHLRRGIGTRTAAALTDLAFTVPGIERVEIHHDVENLASRVVPERLGYERLGERTATRDLAPADTGTDVVWRVDRAVWLARRA